MKNIIIAVYILHITYFTDGRKNPLTQDMNKKKVRSKDEEREAERVFFLNSAIHTEIIKNKRIQQ